MRIVVCVKPTKDGEIGPFEASAYECALRISGAEVILLAMAPARSEALLQSLTRLGAKEAYLLADSAFAGADTLATTYALSLALKKLSPDLIFCGRQTVEGDTAQVGVGLATRMQYALATSVMDAICEDRSVRCTMRGDMTTVLSMPAVLTFERAFELRRPSLRSKLGVVHIWSAGDIGADPALCGTKGSPTRVVRAFENESGKRKCKMISKEEFWDCITKAKKATARELDLEKAESGTPLETVWVYGERAMEMAYTVCASPTLKEMTDAHTIAREIRENNIDAVLWDSSPKGKILAATVAVINSLGLCADCTRLESDGNTLYMYRPAFGGNVVAKIVSDTRPAMATVRTKTDSADVILSIGAGAVDARDAIIRAAEACGAEVCSSRAAVNLRTMKYETQVGLTGKTVAPQVYVALGISGAVHHIAGIGGANTVIAVNADPKAPIFEYADYGIVCDVKELF